MLSHYRLYYSYYPTGQSKIKTMDQYNYPEIIAWLEQKGKLQFGANFRFWEEDKLIINKLITYFLNDTSMAELNEIDLSKGILLSGPIGCGKTCLMSLMRLVAQPDKKFSIKPSRDISFEFIKDGYEVIQRYSSGNSMQSQTKHYCFDDLGTETNLKYYGNECNIMGEILLSRYDLFVSKKIISHITTNLSATEIEQAYGNRVRSRLRQMLNLIAYAPIAKDKR